MDDKIKKYAISAQRGEITEHYVYMRLAASCMDKKNASVLKNIGEQEMKHFLFWKSKTGQDMTAGMPWILLRSTTSSDGHLNTILKM